MQGQGSSASITASLWTLVCVFLDHTRLRAPYADDESVQLTAQKVAFFLQLLDPFLQPAVLLQSHVEVSAEVGHQDEGAVRRGRGLCTHWLC